jgi:hypothetical protein
MLQCLKSVGLLAKLAQDLRTAVTHRAQLPEGRISRASDAAQKRAHWMLLVCSWRGERVPVHLTKSVTSDVEYGHLCVCSLQRFPTAAPS